MFTDRLLLLASVAGVVHAHGTITSPPPRVAGKAMQAACGQQVYNNQASDDGGNIQAMLQVASSQKDYNAAECNVWQCKGYKAEDNAANVQSFSAGQVVPMTFAIRAPHTGVANVSIVDTASNSVIGQPLASYSNFASVSTTPSANESSFSITMPDLAGKCTTAGECVIQHYWNAASINQTYESCIDFTMGGSGAASNASTAGTGAAAAVSSPVAAASFAAAPGLSTSTTLRTSVVTAVVTKAKAATSATAEPTAAAGDDEDDDTCEA